MKNENSSKLLETYFNYVKKVGAVNVDLMAGYSYQTFETKRQLLLPILVREFLVQVKLLKQKEHCYLTTVEQSLLSQINILLQEV